LVGHHLAWGDKYAAKLRSAGNFLFEDMGKNRKVNFKKINIGQFDTEIGAIRPQLLKVEGKGWHFARINTWHVGYMPTICLVALILATPFAVISQKILALLAGLVFFNLYLYAILYVRILFVFNQMDRELERFEPSFFSTLLDYIYHSFTKNIGLLTIIPIFIWLLVAFRKSNFNKASDKIIH